MVLQLPDALPVVAKLRENGVIQPLVERFEQRFDAGKPRFVVKGPLLHQNPTPRPKMSAATPISSLSSASGDTAKWRGKKK